MTSPPTYTAPSPCHYDNPTHQGNVDCGSDAEAEFTAANLRAIARSRANVRHERDTVNRPSDRERDRSPTIARAAAASPQRPSIVEARTLVQRAKTRIDDAIQAELASNAMTVLRETNPQEWQRIVAQLDFEASICLKLCEVDAAIGMHRAEQK